VRERAALIEGRAQDRTGRRGEPGEGGGECEGIQRQDERSNPRTCSSLYALQDEPIRALKPLMTHRTPDWLGAERPLTPERSGDMSLGPSHPSRPGQVVIISVYGRGLETSSPRLLSQLILFHPAGTSSTPQSLCVMWGRFTWFHCYFGRYLGLRYGEAGIGGTPCCRSTALAQELHGEDDLTACSSQHA
jgi:hypothetical protein